MTQTLYGKPITTDELDEWAELNDYDQDDIDNFAAIVQVGQLLGNALSEDGLSHESQKQLDAVYESLYELSSMDEDSDYEDPMEQYIPHLALQDGLTQMRQE